MDEPSYFQNALSSFVADAACGGAVRHLVDIGYTLDQIVDRLDYPAPRAKVQRIMMDYLYESRVLLREEPSAKLFAAKEMFVQEQDAFGRRSMRKVMVDSNSQSDVVDTKRNLIGNERDAKIPDLDMTRMSHPQKEVQRQEILWKKIVYDPKRDGKLTELLHQKCDKNGEAYSYISCSFGKPINDQHSQYMTGNEGKSGKNEKNRQNESGGVLAAEKIWSCLNNRQRDYIQGIRWDQPVLYHRLNQRMLEIVGKLYEAGAYDGMAFFAVSREKIVISSKESLA